MSGRLVFYQCTACPEWTEEYICGPSYPGSKACPQCGGVAIACIDPPEEEEDA